MTIELEKALENNKQTILQLIKMLLQLKMKLRELVC
jgi:hypothetical protein